jgi:hypothetical protein
MFDLKKMNIMPGAPGVDCRSTAEQSAAKDCDLHRD